MEEIRLINANALKEALHNFFDGKVINEPAYILRDVFCHIDNAPTQVVSVCGANLVISNEKINCPQDLNQYLICEPIFENTFLPEECESRKFYGDCYHCFASAIAKRDKQIRGGVK